MIYKYLIYFLLTMTLSACEIKLEKETAAIPSQLVEKVGEEAVTLISHPSEVRVSRVVKTQGQFIPIANGRVLTDREAERLQQLLLNDHGYIFDKTKKCLFIPQLAFHLKGKTDLFVLVSPICQQIRLQDSKQAIVLDYDPMAEQLNSFCQQFITTFNGEIHE